MSQAVILNSRQEHRLHLLEKNKDEGIYKLKKRAIHCIVLPLKFQEHISNAFVSERIKIR